MKNRPRIPIHIKRKVRQRCGFGCVICGLPIYEYDHIPGYATVRRHKSDEITLLCPNHHSEKTKGLLPKANIQEADNNPYNRRQVTSSIHSLWFSGLTPEITLGKLHFTCDDRRRPTQMIPILVHGYAPLGFTLDRKGLMLNLDARDSNNKQVLVIKDSELILSAHSWDATFEGRSLRIWEKSRSLILEIEFRPPHKIVLKRYQVNSAGIAINIDPLGIEFEGDSIPKQRFEGDGTVCANIGIIAGSAPRGLSLGIGLGRLE